MPGIDAKALSEVLSEAGALAMQGFRPGEEIARWHKAPGHPVSESDLAVDRFLQTALRDLDPKAGWLSEESHTRPEKAGHDATWIVDPIDGTRDFIRGRNGWAVSVAYSVDGQPQFSMLYAPARQEMWVAEAGKGASLNGKALHASRHDTLSGARVPTTQLTAPDRLLSMVDKPNSIALRVAMVADNQADLVATLRWGHAWDIAAAKLIAQEAGALCTDALGKAMDFSRTEDPIFGILCSAEGIHDAARKHLDERAKAILAQAPKGGQPVR